MLLRSVRLVAGLALVAVLLLVLIRSSIVDIARFESSKIYASPTAAGQDMRILLRPGNYLVMEKRSGKLYDYALIAMRGSEATHYVGPLYKLRDGLWGLRLYMGAVAVFDASFELVEIQCNLAESTFGPLGQQSRVTVVQYRDALVIGGVKYNEVNSAAVEVDAAFSRFKKFKQSTPRHAK